MRRVILTSFLTSLALLTACSGGPDFACKLEVKSGSGCSEIEELGGDALVAAAEQSCKAQGGTPVDSCPTDNEVGICTVTFGGITQKLHFYSTEGVTAAAGELGCKQLEGSWTGS